MPTRLERIPLFSTGSRRRPSTAWRKSLSGYKRRKAIEHKGLPPTKLAGHLRYAVLVPGHTDGDLSPVVMPADGHPEALVVHPGFPLARE